MTTNIAEHTIRSGNVELYARLHVVDPAQPTVVLLCGLGFHTFEYEPLAAELSPRRVNTISFDYRCHGRSSGPRGRWTLDDLAADTAATIEHARRHGLHRIHLLGNSLGGMIAILAGTRDPDIVSVIASNTPAHVAGFLLTRPRRLLYRAAAPLSAVPAMRISVNHFYRYENLTADTALIERVRRDTSITNARRLTISTYRELLDIWDGPTEISRLHHPILLINGTHDHLQPEDQTRQLLAAANEPKQHRRISTGHLPHLDATVEVADLTTTWIHSTDPNGPSR